VEKKLIKIHMFLYHALVLFMQIILIIWGAGNQAT